MRVECGGTVLTFNPETLGLNITAKGVEWETGKDFKPYFEAGEEKVYFETAQVKEHTEWKTGVGAGVRSNYSGFTVHGKKDTISFTAIVWAEHATGDVYYELIPITESEQAIGNFYWPAPMEFKENSRKWYTLINMLQGILIPNDWPYETGKLVFEGQMCSAGAYMPWFSQVKPDGGYISIACDPYDAAYYVEHPASAGYTYAGIRWLPSMGGLTYKRTLKQVFRKQCDYNDMCKIYREYAKEKGLFVTLKEKAARNPLVEKFIGSAIVHTGIKTHCSPESRYYDTEHPEKNDYVVPFAKREEQMRALKEKGLEKVYLHLDGWGDPGYDNKHPDYLPACVEAGGWDGMKSLSDAMKEMNYMFAIHDNYRDYYFDAPTYDPEFSMVHADGSKPDFCLWAGGWQTYICATQAPLYVRRNFTELFSHGIELEGTYLDVFTCNEPDECIHPLHRMTRKECIEYRKQCFDFLNTNNIIASSEEVADWAVRSVTTAHYGPYSFMLWPNEEPKGIPVPLFNLVYHECVVLPWLMKEDAPQGDYMLYALLNGGAAYLDCELTGEELDHAIERYRTVAALQEKVAESEMVKHEFLDEDHQIQRTTFADGTKVSVNLKEGTYQIES